MLLISLCKCWYILKNDYCNIMSEEVLCAALDNTSINQGGEAIENSNTTCGSSDLVLNDAETEDVPRDTEYDANNQDLPGNDHDQFEFEEDIMTGSYGEISLDQELLGFIKNDSQGSREQDGFHDAEDLENSKKTFKEKRRPNSLVLAKNSSKLDDVGLLEQDLAIHLAHKSQQTSEGPTTSAEVSPSFSSDEFALHSSSHRRTGSDTSGLSELQGTLTVDGDLVTFVAEDLQEKIKMSSPVSRWTDSSSYPGSRSSTPSLYRQALQPSIHIVDPNILTDLEAHTKKVATCVDRMLENLSGTLQSISSLTVDCMGSYENSVCKTCDSVDVNIKAVYQLMAKCEELSNSMGPLYRISDDVKQIKKMLDQLEHVVEHKS